MILTKILLAAILTFAGSFWIEKLYLNCAELTFQDEISSRSRFRKPILFISLLIFILVDDLWIMSAIFLLILMTITDFEQYMLFDAMTFPFALIGAIYAYQNSILQDNLMAGALGGGIFLVLAIISKGALGGGDVKLIFGLGMWLGAEKLLNVVLYGTILGGIAALLMILAKKKERGSYFAYGPYFTLTAIYFLINYSAL